MSDDYDNFEFDDDELNFDDDSFDVSMEPPKDDRNPIAVARDSILTDVGRDLTDPAKLTSVVRDNLPAGYSSAVTAADSFVSSASDLYNEAAAEVGPSIRELKKQTKRALPRLKQYMPESWHAKAEKFLGDEEEQRMQAQGDADTSAINSSLASIFEQQNETDRQEKLEDTAKDLMTRKVEDRRAEASNSTQVSIINKLQELVSYNNKIDSKVSRQSLELQFRSFFTLRDLLEVTKRTSEDAVTHLSDIVKNTGLPDLLKHKPSENALQLLEDSIYGKRVDEVAGKLEPFVAKMKGNLKARAQGAVASLNAGITGASGMITDINDANDQAAEFGGGGGLGPAEIAASMAAGNITNRIFGQIGKGIRNAFGMDTSGTSQRLETEFADIEGAAARLASDEQDVYFAGKLVPNWIRRGFRFAGDAASNAQSLKVAESVSNIKGKETSAVSYDLMSRKTLVEIIPWYMRKQLSKLDILTGGDGAEHVYNPSKGRITSMAKSIKDARSEIFDAGKERQKLTAFTNTVGAIDKEDTLSSIEKRRLAEIMNQSAQAGLNFNAPELVQALESSPDDAELAAKLKELLGIDVSGRPSGGIANSDKLTKITSAYKGIRDTYHNDRQASVGNYARSGSNEILEEAGILEDDGTRKGSELKFSGKLQQRFREQILRTLFRGEIEDNPEELGHLGRREAFVGPQPPKVRTPSPLTVPPTPIDGSIVLIDKGGPIDKALKGSHQLRMVKYLAETHTVILKAKDGKGPEYHVMLRDSGGKALFPSHLIGYFEDFFKQHGRLPDAVLQDGEFKYFNTSIANTRNVSSAMRDAYDDDDDDDDDDEGYDEEEEEEEEDDEEEVYNASRKPKVGSVRAAANYGQGKDTMRKGYGSQKVTQFSTQTPKPKSKMFLDTSLGIRTGINNYLAEAHRQLPGVDLPESLEEISGANAPKVLDDAQVKAFSRRQEEAAKQAEEDKKKEEENRPEPTTMIEHFKELIATNQQGFVDTVEAIMAASPNDEEVRAKYFGSLRKRMGQRIRRVGTFVGSSLKTGKSLALMPFKFVKGIVGGAMDVLTGERDIYVEGEGSDPILTVVGLGRGHYFDENGAVISTLKGLDKPVYGADQNQILTAEHIVKGIYTKSPLGKKVKVWGDKGAAWLRRKVAGALGGTVGKAFKFVRNRVQDVTGFVRKLGNRHLRRDLYLRGELNLPKLTLADLTAGKYFNPETGMPITSFSQIAKGVKDKDNNWILTPEAVEKLVDINGRKAQIRGLIGSAFRLMTKPLRFVGGKIAKLGRYINNKVEERLKTDVYVYEHRGNPSIPKLVPKLYYDAMKRGEYYNRAEDGSIGMSIRTFAEIRGPIVDRKGLIVLSEPQIKAGLFDKNGKRLVIAGTIRYLARTAKNLILSPVKKVFNMAKSFKNWIFGGDELTGKESMMSKISGFFGSLRRPKIETMKVTTDIVYINGKTVLGGGTGLGDAAGEVTKGIKSIKSIIKDRTTAMRTAGASTGQELKDKLAVAAQKGKGFKARMNAAVPHMGRVNTIDIRNPMAPVGLAGTVGGGGGNISTDLLRGYAANRKQPETIADHIKATRVGRLAKLGFGLGTKRMAKEFRKVEKEFGFDFSQPNAAAKLEKLKRKVMITGTRKQKLMIRALEKRMNKHGLRERMSAIGNKFRTPEMVGPPIPELTGPARPTGLQAAKGRLGGFIETVKGKVRKGKSGDTDGDGMRDGGFKEAAVDKAKSLKEKALSLFRRKQVKNGETQVSLLERMLKSMKKTEKNTKEAADGGGGGFLSSILGGGAAAAGGSMLAKVKGFFGGKAATTATQGAARTAATGAGRSVAMNVGRQVVFGVGRSLAMGAATAAAAALGIGVGALAVGAAVVASVGVGAYFVYKYNSRRSEVDAVERFRFISYGLDPNNQDEVVAIRYLEDELEGEVTTKGFKDPIVEVISDYAEDFGIEDDDVEGYKRFGEWLVGRFLPVFMSWTVGAARFDTDLDDIYDDMDRKDYLTVAKATYYGPKDKRDPYAISASPFEGRILKNRDDVKAALRALVDGDGDENYDEKKENPETKTGEKASPKIGVGDRDKDGKLKTVGERKAETLKNTPTLDSLTAKESDALKQARGKKMADKSVVERESDLVTEGVKTTPNNVTKDMPIKPTGVVEVKMAAIALTPDQQKQVEAKNARNLRVDKIVRKRRRAFAQSKRLEYIKKAILAGESTKLPPELMDNELSDTEKDYLARQTQLMQEKHAKGKLATKVEERPAQQVDNARNSKIEARRNKIIEERRRQASMPTGKVDPDAYVNHLREQHLATTMNIDNTLYHMYTVLEDRLPMMTDDEDERAAMAERASERRAEMQKRNREIERNKTPPAALNVKAKVDPLPFNKQRQQRK